jgi:DNA-binding transcriptional LysR family regulator
MADLNQVNLNRLAVFVAVVEAGSMTAAAERLGLAKAVVSAHMQRLEAELGASLLVRTTRRLDVTEAGRNFYQACRQILSTAEVAIAEAAGTGGPLRGTLRVSAPIDYGSQVVTPALVSLRDAQPGLEIELICGDSYVDLIGERIDVAIRLGRLQDSNYRAVGIGSFEKGVVVTPAFLRRWGVPAEPEALADLPYVALSTLPRPNTVPLECIGADGERQQKTIRCGNVFLTNTATSTRAAVLASGGFGLMTDFSVRDDVAAGHLVRLFPAWATARANIQAVFPPTSHPPAKVLALIDALRTQLAQAGNPP